MKCRDEIENDQRNRYSAIAQQRNRATLGWRKQNVNVWFVRIDGVFCALLCFFDACFSFEKLTIEHGKQQIMLNYPIVRNQDFWKWCTHAFMMKFIQINRFNNSNWDQCNVWSVAFRCDQKDAIEVYRFQSKPIENYWLIVISETGSLIYPKNMSNLINFNLVRFHALETNSQNTRLNEQKKK